MKRDLSIDFLKFMAVVFVVNSHMDICYPGVFRRMASGGAFGDALFFFCSGFTLFLGRDGGFGCWYKRRISRILPSTLLCVLAYALWGSPDWWERVAGFWFIRCIFIYYVVLYFIRKYMKDRLWVAFCLSGVVTVAWWMLYEDPRHSIYGGTYFMWCHYFIPMLIGAAMGMYKDCLRPHVVLDVLGLIAFAGLFFVIQHIAMTHAGLEWMQLLTIILLAGTTIEFYRVANLPVVARLMNGGCGKSMVIIGSLCLEVYLSHRIFLTDRLNAYFPANVFALFAAILMLAYSLRSMSRILVQTCDGRDGYDWRAVFRLT